MEIDNGLDVMNTTSHRVYQTGEGERGNEEAANDLGRLRIRVELPLVGPLHRKSSFSRKRVWGPVHFFCRFD